MGLLYSIDTQIGVPATYFNVQRTDCYPRDRVIDITVSGYISKQARLDEKAAVFRWTKRFSYDEISSKTDPTQEDIYNFIKAQPEFLGSEDA